MHEEAGVSTEKGDRVSSNICKAIDGFGGTYTTDLDETLVASIDSCGSKTKFLLDHLSKEDAFEVMAQDIVHHSINELIPQGASAYFFLDYIGTDKLVPEDVEFLAKNISKACRQYGVQLIGGEVCESPLTYKPSTINVVGTIVGTKVCNLSPQLICEGDAVYGLASSGPHTNGYTLLNKLYSPYEEVDERLLKPHKCYFRKIGMTKVKGIAHITGGGRKNMKRVLPKGLRVDWFPYTIPPPFDDIQKRSGMSDDEMFQVFNCGIGVMFIPREGVEVKNNWIHLGQVIRDEQSQ